MTPLARIRNFSIVAHIDHGKSTLADRLIQACGGMTDREMAGQAQVLDNMDIEKERGITIKAQTVRLDQAEDGELYQLNLMDTPGHVDFAYEVSRSLAACEGPLLVVDFSQGVEAQTLANVYQALDNNHEIVPVLNKVDLPAAEPDRVKQQIEDVIGLDASGAVEISAKTGLNIGEVLEAIVHRLPPPKGDAKAPLKALLVDSGTTPIWALWCCRVVDGLLKKGMRIKLMSTDAAHLVDRVGIFRPKQEMLDVLGPGEVGFFTAAIKEVADTRVGDTVTEEKRQRRRCLASSRCSRWCSAASSRSTPRNSRICARPWAGCASTTPASNGRWRRARRWASASAAASWASCTSKSSASGSNANSTSTSSPPRRASSITSI